MISNPNDVKSISAKARARRIQLFANYAVLCGITDARILDIGGTVDYWKMNLQYVPEGLIKSIDVVNLPPQEENIQRIAGVSLHAYAGDALDKTTLRQDSYDIVYSNSVIEHVGNLRSQRRMAMIIMSTGKYFWVQTPAKSFPIEPHFYFPFFVYLPLSFRTFLYRHIKLGFMGKQPNWLEARMSCEETRLLTKLEFLSIFDGCDILKEKWYGICKSYMATNMKTKALHHSR